MKTATIGENKNEEKHQKARKGEEEKMHISGLKGGQRIKMVEAAPSEETPILDEAVANGMTTEKTNGPERTKRVERVRGKKYQESKKKFDSTKAFSPSEAIKIVKDTSYSKFDGTVELHLIVKKVGTSVQVSLPYQAGKQKRVEIASDETVQKLRNGKIDFDILVATAEMMPKIVPFARLLGPKGLMPNPKNGTLVTDLKKAQSFSASSVTIKTEKEAPLIHTVVGKVSQKDSELVENLEVILKALGGGKQIGRAFLKATMGPAVKVKI